jgi:ergothioneine biosynthesis protein EgtB
MSTASLKAPLSLAERYRAVRGVTEEICRPLQIEEYVLQPTADASPPRWHLGHVTWFFERFVLVPHAPGYRPRDSRFDYLFNSYYNSVGARTDRPRRGLVTRPTVSEVYAWRAAVDEAVLALVERGAPAAALAALELGLQHEQQHQELLLTDILAIMFQEPIFPSYDPAPRPLPPQRIASTSSTAFPGGVLEIGHHGAGFGYDNETPRHRVLLEPYKLADDLVTNGQYLEFMRDGGYQDPLVWLSDGWDAVRHGGWEAPLYWVRQDGEWMMHTLRGLVPVDPLGPVSQVSFYEADAFARWAGKRLPTEAEWEVAASACDPRPSGMLEDGWRVPLRESAAGRSGPRYLLGQVWEWTASAYLPYPGYRAPEGAFGEYNAKFMINQMVLRGGSCATPRDHVRISYRNFFHPDRRWQYTGIRLAEDAR